MTRDDLAEEIRANLSGTGRSYSEQVDAILNAADKYATSQASAALELLNAPLWHALTLNPVGAKCGAVGVNTTNTRLVNCPDCLKETP